MKSFKYEFLSEAIKNNVLTFGEFELKSGRTSPYFFNAGKFSTGSAITMLGRCYAAAIVESNLQFDMLFGPAYKGIPLTVSTVSALHEIYGLEIGYCYNRKERKTHGEGGSLVGAPPVGNILIIDDVITAGTAVTQVFQLLDKEIEASVVGVTVGLDRKEITVDGDSVAQKLQKKYGIPIISVVDIDDIFAFLLDRPEMRVWADAVGDYRHRYGI
ncbi:MAG: orotate phosphoribosyltransferase [Cellvibrionales bacterium TMED49]|nr:orotate phosphoribosyltransferase [Porticoccaceae bacterium]OUU38814.1 MAG: orotate phosphoribosyltransferase [Cellvibrionales bacterium TMED49]|tara:strand:+ start:688 stop:1332 length:645 start_codon:yes stop_codon:yes gene_type:complete